MIKSELVQRISLQNPHLYQRDVENKLQNALKFDRARVQLGRISKFGLLEMSRQRLRPSLGESSQLICPRCEGHGRMRSIESLSLSILRVAEEHAMKENTGQVLVQVPVEIANYLLNEKRRALGEIEQRHEAPIVIVADDQLETPHYEVTRLRENELGEEASKPSYQRGTPRKLATIALTRANLNVPVAAVVDTNCDPDGITFVVPGNDDAARAITLYCDLIARAAIDGISRAQGDSGVDTGAALRRGVRHAQYLADIFGRACGLDRRRHLDGLRRGFVG